MKAHHRSAKTAVLWLAATLPSAAHSLGPGAGSLMNGLAHPALTPEHWLAVGGGALWAGQSGESGARRFISGLLAGGIAGMAIRLAGLPLTEPSTRICLLAAMAGGGGAAAAKIKCSGWPAALAGGLVSACILWQTLAEARELGNPAAFGFGALAGVSITGLIVAGISRSLSSGKAWRAIAVRVAGSWLFAIAILMLALPSK